MVLSVLLAAKFEFNFNWSKQHIMQGSLMCTVGVLGITFVTSTFASPITIGVGWYVECQQFEHWRHYYKSTPLASRRVADHGKRGECLL
jgi:hypothetical protein